MITGTCFEDNSWQIAVVYIRNKPLWDVVLEKKNPLQDCYSPPLHTRLYRTTQKV